jgi:hypothetical protein
MEQMESEKLEHESEVTFQERRAFESQLQSLLSKYRGKYVAFLGGRVVDIDENDERLAARMFVKYGESPFYIGEVADSPSIYEISSPEIHG